ncbi:MBL fold metallo-hydrolase [Pseudomonas kuykendallii]|uniref:Metallo-beta-lactamase superfamily protein n=1 Tax=Pseudomonas kuykendallii TaxID=1007099 RepID=A0A1H3B8D7_9PSED|nr:MBL fold metallo-hydrolase [Pseudomonas kuykendallii]MCQ4270012.1 MBL fold metallo-hydrolase [Pseudomonas kuykendallii]SDX38196.1 Metallo-beta-lactamase superfamily protein [Pseudomonas kuykendallii]
MGTSIPNGSMAVRMYRGILGDCFLLRYGQAGRDIHILIDCGVLQGVKGAKEQMKRIVDDLHATTGGVLDLVVLTHEHHDHLSGFLYEKERFFGDAFTIDELWLAWTENPSDPQAIRLHARFDKVKSALAKVTAIARSSSAFSQDPRIGTVAALAEFIPSADGGDAVGAKQSIIERLRRKAGGQATRYLEPGDVVRPRAAPTLKVNVMGPPRDEQRLRKDLPSAGAGKEVYLSSLDEAIALEDHALRALGEPVVEQGSPFAQPHRRSREEARKAGTARPSGPLASIEQRYFDDAQAWRNIEDEWLDSAECIALKMDSDTNNTSLVLAFELPDGQVLLFPGDAQVGNWIFWGDQTYPRAAIDGEPAPQVLDDILRRVTLYKVGHHCSHNATAKALGLEKMTDSRLVAMIPVVAAVAEGKGWQMPYPELLTALQARTQRRVLVGDSDPEREAGIFAQNPTSSRAPAELSYAQDGLWVELGIRCVV